MGRTSEDAKIFILKFSSEKLAPTDSNGKGTMKLSPFPSYEKVYLDYMVIQIHDLE